MRRVLPVARILPSLVVVFEDGDGVDEAVLVEKTGRCDGGEVYLDKVYVDGASRPALIALGECGVEMLRSTLEELGVHLVNEGGSPASLPVHVSVSDSARKGRGEYDSIVVGEGGEVCVNVYSGRELVWRCCTSIGDVERVYNVIAEECRDAPCRTRDVARRVAEKAGVIDEYGGADGFDWKRFFGDRERYHRLLYCPLRILRRLGLIAYNRGYSRLKTRVESVRAALEEYAKKKETYNSIRSIGNQPSK